MTAPRVTIAIPAYKAAFLDSALESAFGQDYAQGIEVLVCDDCPDDSVAQRIQPHVGRPGFRYLRNAQPLLEVGNFARCLTEARGHYVKFLCDDDVLAPECVRLLAGVLDAHEDVTLVSSRRSVIGPDGDVLAGMEANHFPFRGDTCVHGADLVSFLGDRVLNFIGEPTTVMFRRAQLLPYADALFSLGGQRIFWLGDLVMHVHLMRQGHLAMLDRTLSSFRISDFQSSHTARTVAGIGNEGHANFRRMVRELGWYRGVENNGFVRTAPLQSPCIFEATELGVRVDRMLQGMAPFQPEPELEVVPERVAAVVHVFYPELWPEFCAALRRLPRHADIFVTTAPEHREMLGELLQRDLTGARLIVCENRGRDVGPFLAVMDAVRLEDYDYVLKVHSKKSPHLGGEAGATWRRHILGQLLPEAGLDIVWDQLRTSPRVGLLSPGGQLLDAQVHLGRDNRNQPAVQRLARQLGFDFDRTPYRFAAGTMFWMRGIVVGALRDLGLRQRDFEDEAGQLDGTLAHAVERIMPLVARRAGLETDEVRIGAGLLAGLMAQVPSASDGRLIEQRLAAHGGGPVVGVFVRDLRGDEKRLVETLSSLVYGTGLYANVRTTILTTRPVGQTSVDDPVHLVAADEGDWTDVLNLAIMQRPCDWIVVVDAGDVFARAGLLHAALQAIDAPDARALCCDELRRLPNGALGAAFRPDANLDLLMSLPASMSRRWLVKRASWLEAGGFDPVRRDAAEFDLLLRLVEQGGTAGLLHVQEPLLATDTPEFAHDPHARDALLQHLRRRGYPDAAVDDDALPGRYRIRYGHAHQPLVSIIIPTKDQLPILQRCVESLLEKTSYPNYEVLIVDNASETEEARQWLGGVEAMQSPQVRILRHPAPFNYSAINNVAAAQAGGEYLVLLNNDTAILRGDWLDALLNHALRPEVGVVGAKLLYPDGGVQHAGVVLGLRGPADHPFLRQPFDAAGYMHRLEVDQDYSAVTGACMMIRKSVYDEVGGLDEQAFKVSYNDIDLCLKVRTAGYLVVWTPHAVVMHEGSVSQTRVDRSVESAKQARFAAEQDAMYERWLPLLARDPAYNRYLALHGDGFEFEPNREIRWQPLPWKPVPVVRALAADHSGCGHYRIIQPLQAMVHEGLVQGLVGSGHATPVLLERYAPDTLVFQRQLLDTQIESMRRARRFSSAFTVYELDDYLPGVPTKSAHWGTLPADIVKSMRRALAQADRFVVSTEALADAFDGFHADIRVVRNRLPPAWWAGLRGRRHAGRKPRVGWAGGGGHRGDLELIADVVKELADEVDWVFFGMCPESLRPFVGEFHPPVDIERYPAMLAALDLDLALAPLEKNLFNECKSNLRLLEYGACGFPVICSDIGGYQDTSLPVMRVKNRFKDWVAAIRMHLADRDAMARAGDALQEAVRRDWMLQGEHLLRWRDAWTAA